jgi:hypothetical protein
MSERETFGWSAAPTEVAGRQLPIGRRTWRSHARPARCATRGPLRQVVRSLPFWMLLGTRLVSNLSSQILNVHPAGIHLNMIDTS